jgi:purine-binding chemotaxis protein CheW
MEKTAASQSSQDIQKLKQLIVFRVADEEFGVPIETVQEIIKMGMVTPIPDSPEFIKGLINVRGDIVAIIDLRARFFLSVKEEISKHIIIAKQAENVYGLMVAEVIEILRIQEEEVKPPPHLMTKIHEEYVQGVITHEGRLIILLDIDLVLSEQELVRLAELMRNHHKDLDFPDSTEFLAIKTHENLNDLSDSKKKNPESKKRKK